MARTKTPVVDQDFNQFMATLEKKFGDDLFETYTDDTNDIAERLPTQSERLNRILNGGIPVERITEIYGPEHTGKSSLAYGVMAEAQKAGHRAALFDIENAFEPLYAASVLGLDIKEKYRSGNFKHVPPLENGEIALDLLEAMVRSHFFKVIVVDSVAALSPEAEVASGMEQQLVGTQARMISKALRKLTTALHGSGCAVIFINQERVDIGKFSPHGGTPTTTPGGKALRFYASCRIEVRKGKDLKTKANGTVIGHELRLLALKNRGNFPRQRCGFDVLYGKGINNFKEISELAVETGVIHQGGAWLSLIDENGEIMSAPDGTKYQWQGVPNYLKYLAENMDLYETIRVKLKGTAVSTEEATAAVPTADEIAEDE